MPRIVLVLFVALCVAAACSAQTASERTDAEVQLLAAVSDPPDWIDAPDEAWAAIDDLDDAPYVAAAHMLCASVDGWDIWSNWISYGIEEGEITGIPGEFAVRSGKSDTAKFARLDALLEAIATTWFCPTDHQNSVIAFAAESLGWGVRQLRATEGRTMSAWDTCCSLEPLAS